MTGPTSLRWAAPTTAAIVACTFPSCSEFSTEQVSSARGTLGEEISEILCERIARDADPTDVSGARWKPVCAGERELPADAPPRLMALVENRERLVAALDRIFPAELEDELGLFVSDLLPFFDEPEERLVTQTRKLADFLEALSQDDEAIAALERLGARQGYRPLRNALGVVRPVLAYPEFNEFAEVALVTLLEGSTEDEFRDLLRAVALEMATAEESTDPSPTTLELTRELLFIEGAAFQSGEPSWISLRDNRGLVIPASEAGGGFAAPFADQDGDALADVDSLGRFIDVAGSPLDIPAPFPTLEQPERLGRDEFGRALRSDDSLYYRYFDASQTMLAGVSGEVAPWLRPETPTLFQLGEGLPVLLGSELASEKRFGAFSLGYRGFNTDEGPALDSLSAIAALWARPEFDDLLQLLLVLLADYEAETAGAVRAGRFLAVRADDYPSARLSPNSIFWDDVILLLARMSEEPRLLERLIESFADPRSAELSPVLGAFLRNRDRVTFDAANLNGEAAGFPLDEPVDRAAADTFDNESLFQRTVALIDGLNGVQLCNREGARLDLTLDVFGTPVPLSYPLNPNRRLAECELIQIDNVVEAYARSVIGQYELEFKGGFLNLLVAIADGIGIDVDAALEAASGIEGLTRNPTPEAFNRLVFWALADNSGVGSCEPDENGGDCNSTFAGQLFSPLIDRHGEPAVERYQGTIFAWELPGFYEGLTPILEVLHSPAYTFDSEGNYYFGDLIRTLHLHWGSTANTQTCGPANCMPGEPRFSYQSNARSYEGLLADGFVEGALFQELQSLATALEAAEVRPGQDGVVTAAAAAESVLDPARNEGFVDRAGRSETRVNDGSRTVAMTPLYQLLESLSEMDRRWELQPERRQEFLLGRAVFAEQFLATEPVGDEVQLANRRGKALIEQGIRFVQARIAFHRADGDLDTWAEGLDERFANEVNKPVIAALIRFLDAVSQDEEARRVLVNLLGYLVDVASENDAFQSTLYGLADALMVVEDDDNLIPLLQGFAPAIAPNIDAALGDGIRPDLDGGATLDLLDLLRDIEAVDDGQTLERILENSVSVSSAADVGEAQATPLEVVIDVLAEVNRVTPNEGGSLRDPDYRAVFGQTVDFVRDEDHGLERLHEVLQARSCLPEEARICDGVDAVIPSQSSCYVDAQCRCTASEAGLRWRCAP